MLSTSTREAARGHICFVALGTRGDVQPLACIALHLQQTRPGVVVSFITHSAHASWLSGGVFSRLNRPVYLDSPPAGGSWGPPGVGGGPQQGPQDAAAAAGAAAAGAVGTLTSTSPSSAAAAAGTAGTAATPAAGAAAASRVTPTPSPTALLSAQPDSQVVGAIRRCMSAADAAAAAAEAAVVAAPPAALPTAASSSSPQTTPQPEQQHHHPPSPPPQQQQQQPPSNQLSHQQQQQHHRTRLPHLLCFNLFAQEAYHAAEALQVRCAVAAPYMIPYTCPPAFTRMFARELPELYESLVVRQQREGVRQQEEPEQEEAAGGLPDVMARVTYAEVSHWMWPLFTERWGEWRCETLGLPPLPLHRPHHPHPHQPHPGEPQEEPLTGSELPPAPPLLYGFSEVLVPRPPHWPRSVAACGFWQPHREWFADHDLPAELEDFLTTGSTPTTAPATDTATATATVAGDDGGNRLDDDVSAGAVEAKAHGEGTTPPAPVPHPVSSDDSVGPQLGCVVVDFGSSGRLGLIPDPWFTLAVLQAALDSLGLTAIVLTSGWEPLHAAASELQADAAGVCGQRGAAAAAATGAGSSDCGNAEEKKKKKTEEKEAQGLGEHAGVHQRPAKRQARPAAEAPAAGSAGRSILPPPPLPPPPPPSAAAAAAAPPPPPPQRRLVMTLFGGDVAHAALLPRCRLVLHHGGSGTTAAALLCGVPQVVCPLHFDQHFWAERLAYLDLSPPPLPRDVLFGSRAGRATQGQSSVTTAAAAAAAAGAPNDIRSSMEAPAGFSDPRVIAAASRALAAALKDALGPDKLRAARRMAQELAQEDGLEAASRALMRCLAA